MTSQNQPHPDAHTGITAPRGFRAAATTAGLKPSGKPDMALVVNEGPASTAAAVFTRNKVCAAPVHLSKSHIDADGEIKAVLFNSGNANACTGSTGAANAHRQADLVAERLGLEPTDVALCSTGMIGENLPMDKIETGIDSLTATIGDEAATALEAGREAATAIMTTDTVCKQAFYQGEGWSMGATVKGSGMIAPSLATMLGLITTDAVVSPSQAKEALRRSTSVTFDRLDIDGSTSTNDTIILMASGASGVRVDEHEFAEAVHAICENLTEQMQSDAEGVTKRVSITVKGCTNDSEALTAARTIGRDNLTKCAMFGSDPNWGRVLAAVGIAEVDMDASNISVWFNDHLVCEHSGAVPDSRNVDLSGKDIHVLVDLGTGGSGQATVRTTDLSYAYVEINSEYST